MVCLISALTLHELTDEVPAVVQIAVPRGTHRPRIAYPPTEVSEFDPRTFNLGVQAREVAPGAGADLWAGSLGRGRDETTAPGGGPGGAAGAAALGRTPLGVIG